MIRFPLMYRIKNIHFVGIGGSGMSGIAEVLLKQGYQISGSDINENPTIFKLRDLGAKIFLGHDKKNIEAADVLVVSSAIKKDNPEVIAAKKELIPILPRAQMLAELMRFRHGIAVAGTHGKTTTTSLIARIFAKGGLDPTFVIGGILNSAGTHAGLGESSYFVAEADESDASFLCLNPTISVVTNIDVDHMTTYNNDVNKLHRTFINFLRRLPFYGIAVVCVDDSGVQSILPKIARPTVTYGFSENADIRAFDFVQNGLTSHFKVFFKSTNKILEINLNLPGRHNVLNTLAAIAVAKECGVNNTAICRALSQFKGVGRRIEMHGEIRIEKRKIILIDDYGHHPQEIKATLEAIRAAWPNKRLVLVFQPHRYTRLQFLFKDFVEVLSAADRLLLFEIHSAGENPIEGVDSKSLVKSIKKHGKITPLFVEDINALIAALPKVVQDDDILLVQGAGSIGKAVPELKAKFSKGVKS